MIALVTGEIGSGKTTACQRAVDLLRARGVACYGVLSPARLDRTGAKIGIDVLDVATGNRRRLADLMPGAGETIGDYTFDQAALKWAIDQLMRAVAAANHSGEAGLLVVDEIGPLELVRRSGYVLVLEPLADPHQVPRGLVVVRCEHADVLELRIMRPDVRRLLVDEAHREGVPGEIAAAFG